MVKYCLQACQETPCTEREGDFIEDERPTRVDAVGFRRCILESPKIPEHRALNRSPVRKADLVRRKPSGSSAVYYIFADV